MESVGELLARTHCDLLISKQKLRKARTSQWYGSDARMATRLSATPLDRSSYAACRCDGRRAINYFTSAATGPLFYE